MPRVSESDADLVWLVYDLDYDLLAQAYTLVLKDRVYCQFGEALDRISQPTAGSIAPFLDLLQSRLDKKLTGAAPDISHLLDMTERAEPG